MIYYYVVLNLSITLYLCINHSNHKGILSFYEYKGGEGGTKKAANAASWIKMVELRGIEPLTC